MSLLRYFPCRSGEENELPSAKRSRIDDDNSDCASSDIEGDIGPDNSDHDESNFTKHHVIIGVPIKITCTEFDHQS